MAYCSVVKCSAQHCVSKISPLNSAFQIKSGQLNECSTVQYVEVCLTS